MKSPTLFALAIALTTVTTQANAQSMTSAPPTAPESAQPDQPAMPSQPVAPKAGDAVYDNTGVVAGSVDSVANQQIVMSTDKGKAAIPISSLGMGSTGLMINLSKAQLDAAVVAAKGAKPAG